MDHIGLNVCTMSHASCSDVFMPWKNNTNFYSRYALSEITFVWN